MLATCQAYKIRWAITVIIKLCNMCHKLWCWQRGGSDKFFYTILCIVGSTDHPLKFLIPFVFKITKIIHTLLQRYIKIQMIISFPLLQTPLFELSGVNNVVC